MPETTCFGRVQPAGGRVGRVGRLRPVRGEDVVRAAAEEEGAHAGGHPVDEAAEALVAVREAPASLREAVPGLLPGAAGCLVDAVEGTEVVTTSLPTAGSCLRVPGACAVIGSGSGGARGSSACVRSTSVRRQRPGVRGAGMDA
ncbi:hypothetical protein GCM10010266_30170 [Streptomyces griseomycini]|nr:hypothetical protein GCM10010266_30170 [Streptomyces griseomycini]